MISLVSMQNERCSRQKDFGGLFICYQAKNSESKTVEISFVGICSALTILSA